MQLDDPSSVEDVAAEEISIVVNGLTLRYPEATALDNVSVNIIKNRVTAFIGPSGCGKSTLLRCFNRMNDLIDGASISGSVLHEGNDIYSADINVSELRRSIGMVFQRPNPFPKSIFENVCYGLKLEGERSQAVLQETVEWALKSAALWDEVKDRLDAPALELSGGQQQRLVIARAIAIQPSVLLLDEPASNLDPISTLRIEELITSLKDQYTIVLVTHNMQQAARVSDYTAFLNMGQLIEYGETEQLFRYPREKQREDYITGRYG